MVPVTKEKKGGKERRCCSNGRKRSVNENMGTTLVHSVHCKDVLEVMVM